MKDPKAGIDPLDENQRRIRQFLSIIIGISFGATSIYGVVLLILSPTLYLSLLIIVVILLHLSLTWWIARRGYLTLASLSVTIGLWFLLTVSFYFTNGVTNPSISGYMLIIVMASLLLGGRAGIWFAAATFVALTVLLWLELANLLPPFANDTPLLWQTYTIQNLYFFILATMLLLTNRNIDRNNQRNQEIAATLRLVNASLQREIAQKQQVEGALRESEARYRTLVDHAPDAIVVLNVDSRQLVDVNQSAVELFGRGRDPLLSANLLQLAPEQQPDGRFSATVIWDQVNLALQGELPVFEWTVFGPNQEPIICELRLVLLPSSRTHLIRCSIVDIRERKRAEEQQRLERKRLEQIIDTIPAAVIIIAHDENHTILWINETGARFAGLPASELIGRSTLDFYVDEKIPADLMSQLQERGFVNQFEVRLKNAQGIASWNRVSLTPFDYLGQPAHISILINTQKLKLAEEALRESEARFRDFVEHSFSGIVVSVNGVIVDVNERFAQMFGYPKEEMIGLTPIETQTPESAQRVLAHIAAKEEGPVEGVGVRKDGTTFPLEITARNTIYKGQPARLGGVIDLTEKKRVEEVLRQTQKMDSLGLLAGGVAHDFNNLLVAMLGQASVALVKMGESDPARPHIEKVKKVAERAAVLTHHLLAYSGGGQFHGQPLDLNQLIQENIPLFDVAIPSHIQLEMVLDDTLPQIEGDEGQLQQIVMNLIINGVEAIGHKQGWVRLSTGLYYLNEHEIPLWQLTGSWLNPGVHVSLEIKDNGSGMDETTLARIFDPFFSTKATGRGLGLAAVLGIVRGHKGGIRVTSQPGQGTHYRLLFPALPTETPLPHGTDDLAQAGTLTGTILVVDDELWVREAAADILALEGLRVLTAEDGQQGLALYQHNQAHIQLVLLDLSMPGMNGQDSYHHLRQLNPQLHIILSSGYSEKDVESILNHDPLVHFLQKPYDQQQLLRCVHSALQFSSRQLL